MPAATFGWLCVETRFSFVVDGCAKQPPSGGCVLKHSGITVGALIISAATFGWLYVETKLNKFE